MNGSFLALVATAALLFGCAPPAAGPLTSTPIIDMHFHASWPEDDDEADRAQTLQTMDANGIVLSVLFTNEPDDIPKWIEAAPGRFLAGPAFPCMVRNTAGARTCNWNGADWPDLDWLRSRYESGDYRVMGEMMFVYAGIAPDDARMAPYWSLAEEFDIPVGVHINRGPPVGASPRVEGCCPDFNSDLGDPALLRPALERHPNLRIWLQHAGLPPADNISYMEETIAILKSYPNVYVDFSVLNSIFDAGSHEAALRRFIAEDLVDRVMFGTDNMPASEIIARLEGFDFLTAEQRRGVFYDNAAQFLRLDSAMIKAHHSQ